MEWLKRTGGLLLRKPWKEKAWKAGKEEEFAVLRDRLAVPVTLLPGHQPISKLGFEKARESVTVHTSETEGLPCGTRGLPS